MVTNGIVLYVTHLKIVGLHARYKGYLLINGGRIMEYMFRAMLLLSDMLRMGMLEVGCIWLMRPGRNI